jgi:hypothetical protein
MVKPSADAWRLSLGPGLGGLGILNAVLGLSIASNLVPVFLQSPC